MKLENLHQPCLHCGAPVDGPKKKLYCNAVCRGKAALTKWNAQPCYLEHEIWRTMRYRCTNPTGRDYHRYGGRGIKVCERWQKFENFYADMGPKPEGCTVERMDNFGDYEPSNCIWAPMSEQNQNKRNVYTASQDQLIIVARLNGLDWKSTAAFVGKSRSSVEMRARRLAQTFSQELGGRADG